MFRSKKKQRANKGKVLEVDASIQGTLVFSDPVNLCINRRFEGDLDIKGNLIIGEKAIVHAEKIKGEDISVAGKLKGNIIASKRLKLIPPAVVTGDMKQVSEVIRLCGERLTVLSGDDFTTLTLLALGGKGVISVSANIAPGDVSAMCKAWEQGNIEEARRLHFKLEPLNQAMFIETNPIPVKTALSMMGKIQEEFRLPLCPMSDENKEKLRKILINYGLSLK